jgi:hypothetical protein
MRGGGSLRNENGVPVGAPEALVRRKCGPVQRLAWPLYRPLPLPLPVSERGLEATATALMTASQKDYRAAVGYAGGRVVVVSIESLQSQSFRCVSGQDVAALAWTPATAKTAGAPLLLAIVFRDWRVAIIDPDMKCRHIVDRPPASARVRDGAPLQQFQVVGLAGAVGAAEAAPSGEYLAMGCRGGQLRVIPLTGTSFAPVLASETFYGGVTCLAWSPNSRLLAAGSEDDAVAIWELVGWFSFVGIAGRVLLNSLTSWPGFEDGARTRHGASFMDHGGRICAGKSALHSWFGVVGRAIALVGDPGDRCRGRAGSPFGGSPHRRA